MIGCLTETTTCVVAKPLVDNIVKKKFCVWSFRLKNIWIRRTVSWKITCILAPHSTLAVNFISSSMNFNVFGRLVWGGEIYK